MDLFARHGRALLSCGAIAAVCAALGCSDGGTDGKAHAGPNPILFVTQVPITGFARATSLFGNQRPTILDVPRGGDLYIRYPDGKLRNLTREAGFGTEGLQDGKGIAVREPSVHWSGDKALFSMIDGGAAKQFEVETFHWQIYEITGLADGEKAVITKVLGQPEDFNNVSPLYGTDDRVIFTSDRPRSGEAHLYPQLDEYESTPTVTGLWSLDPASGELFLVNHTASGVFSPSIDSFGRLIFTKWDHLQRDQQADADKFAGGEYGSFNFADESAGAAQLSNNKEVFPEPRVKNDPDLRPNETGHTFNQFFPWQINEDGSGEETMNHVGRQEFGGTYSDGSFTDDPNLTYYTPETNHQNRFYVGSDGGFFHIKEDPARPGIYFATNADEFGTDSAGGHPRDHREPSLDAEHMVITPITAPVTRQLVEDGELPDPLHSGHYRNPLPLSDGTLVAVHTAEPRGDKDEGAPYKPSLRYSFRLKTLQKAGDYYVADELLTAGIQKTVTWYDPDYLWTWSGDLWELDPVEVRARPRPERRLEALDDPEIAVMQKKGVDVGALRAWLMKQGLALIVSRNVTSRDRSDVQQPFDLRVHGGAETVAGPGKVYDISYMQLFQADQIRGYTGFQQGRRVLPQPMHDPAAQNPPLSGAPEGSVKLGLDGSMAAFVPARRAMTWQLTGPDGTPVVRERNWVSFAPGEIRVCASCHGVNTVDQAGKPAPKNEPAALGDLLEIWKQQNP